MVGERGCDVERSMDVEDDEEEEEEDGQGRGDEERPLKVLERTREKAKQEQAIRCFI